MDEHKPNPQGFPGNPTPPGADQSPHQPVVVSDRHPMVSEEKKDHKKEESQKDSRGGDSTHTPPPVPPEGGSKKGRIAIVLLIVLGVAFLLYRNSGGGEEQTEQTVREIAPFELKDDLKELVIISNFANSVEDGEPTATFDKKLTVSGQFEKGFVYVKARINNMPIQEPDDVYLNLTAAVTPVQYETFGGHLIAGETLDIEESNETTELLYDLAKVPFKERYFETEENIQMASWLDVLNNHDDHRIVAFLSTIGSGMTEQVSIFYECEKGSNCSIEIKE